MSLNSLTNFGVPGLNGERSAQFQPILSNRYRALFYNFGSVSDGAVAPYDLTRQMRRIGRPQLEFEVQTLYSYVSTVYIGTRGEWGTVDVVLVDDIENTVQRRVQNQVAKQQNFSDQTMSRAGENYKFEIDLDVLAGGQSAGGTAADPNILQKWCYVGCHIVSMNLGEMSYEEAAPMEVTMTLRYDNVIGFDQNGSTMGGIGTHTQEINNSEGLSSTGIG
jgi:hypothetical protein